MLSRHETMTMMRQKTEKRTRNDMNALNERDDYYIQTERPNVYDNSKNIIVV